VFRDSKDGQGQVIVLNTICLPVPLPVLKRYSSSSNTGSGSDSSTRRRLTNFGFDPVITTRDENSSELIEGGFSDQVQILRETLRLMRFTFQKRSDDGRE